MNPHFIEAQWPAPDNVIAFSTTRVGGYSTGKYKGLNLGHHVGDDPVALAANKAKLRERLPITTRIQWLSQVHGTQVVHAGTADDGYPEADACWTREPGEACAILSADCLPVLFCNIEGTVAGAAHAGWRGLLAGVLEKTVGVMNVSAEELIAWMGPAIGPGAFEVGPEVKSQFLDLAKTNSSAEVSRCFSDSERNSGHYMADLYALARLRLSQIGVRGIYGGDLCTYSDRERFFSYRRDGETGRMASLICINPS